jgi:signal transduction histidine kinase
VRPLDRIPSIKVKFTVVIVAAVAISAIVSTVGLRAGIPLWARPLIAAGIALLLVYPFSRGLTSPLREMVRASRSMATGDFDVPVRSTSQDEVGELARAFDAMREQLAEVDRQRTDFVANASHELRTPIAALRASLENLVDGVDPPDRHHLEVLLEQAERLGTLVDQLLDLSRLESGAAALHLDELDLRTVLEQAARDAAPQWPGVSVEVVEGPPAACRCDPTRVRQVVDNLLHNAARHVPEGGTVELAVVQAADATYMTVTDDGPGIPEDERTKVVERFYRSDHARSSDRGGSGLGLAIARSIVDLHGGVLRIEENDPRGCRMVVLLPAAGAGHG